MIHPYNICDRMDSTAFIHSYLNYGHIAWRSANKTKFKKVVRKRKQAVAVVMNNKALNTNDIMKDLNILTIFKLNICLMLIFMFCTGQGTEVVNRRCFVKKVFLEISHDSQENTCA